MRGKYSIANSDGVKYVGNYVGPYVKNDVGSDIGSDVVEESTLGVVLKVRNEL